MTVLDQVFPPYSCPDWPAELGTYFSASRAATFDRCPEIFRRRYVLGEREKPAGAPLWGQADHRAHEVNWSQKITTGDDVPVDVVQDAFVDTFDQLVDDVGGADEVVWDKSDAGDTPQAQAADVRERGVRLVGAYHRKASPSVQPVAVEQKISLDIPGIPVPVIGYIDIVTADRVVERKTAKQKSMKSEWSSQSAIYQAAVPLPFHWHLSVKTKTPQICTPDEFPELAVPQNPRATEKVTRLLQMTIDQILWCWEKYGPFEPWPGARNRPQSPCSWCGWGPNASGLCGWWVDG